MIKNAKYRYKKNVILALAALLVGVATATLLPSPVFVQAQQQEQKIRECGPEDAKNPNPANPCIPGDKIKPQPNPAAENTCNPGESCSVTRILGNNSLIVMYINPIIRTLTAIIGVVIVIALVVSGIQYSASGGDPSAIAAAKKRIMNVIIALLAYIFMAAFINWLLPGGLIGIS